ncbi:MAG: hypothetical protein DWQ04_14795 [Chloroflexi bacterium]|nr:MAG: hypothetical protein DWQ04_14795 [Chloroflexota bacterium]
MAIQTMTLNDIQRTGLEVLSRELGPVGMVRFLQMFEMGEGDYIQQRQDLLEDQKAEDIVRRIREQRPNYKPEDKQ